MPPRPWAFICLVAARAISQLWVTFASMISPKVSAGISSIKATLFIPDATTSMSSCPNSATVRSTIPAQDSSESGRALISMAGPVHAAEISSTFARLPPARATLHPAPERHRAATAPNAPDAPVINAAFPEMSKSERGFSDCISLTPVSRRPDRA